MLSPQKVFPNFIEANSADLEIKIVFDETFKEILFLNESLSELLSKKMVKYLSYFKDESFRFLHIEKAVQFLVHYSNKKQTLYILSPHAYRELSLIKWQASDNHQYAEIKDIEKIVNEVVSEDVRSLPTISEQTTALYDLPDLFHSKDFEKLRPQSLKQIAKLTEKVKSYHSSFFEKFSDMGLNLTAQYELFRIHLLKFLAILPSLDYDKKGAEVKRILLETMRRILEDSNQYTQHKLPIRYFLLFHIIQFIVGLAPASVVAKVVRFSTKMMAKRFISGENIEKSIGSLKELNRSGRDFTLDQLGELVVSEKEADVYCNEVLSIISGMNKVCSQGSKNKAGIAKAHVSIKVSALCSDFKPEAFAYTYALVAPRLKKILLAGKESEVFINIDAEHYHYRDLVFDIYKKVLLETPELKDYQQTGIVLQAYLRDSFEHFVDILSLSRERGLLMPIRLVKGAYWDAETIEGDAHSFPAPQFLNKEETDINFRQLVYKLLEHGKDLQLCIGSHNIQDHCWAETVRSELFSDSPIIEHQCLHMTYEALSVAMTQMNWPVRNYVPIGSLLVGMAYLVRRIMENSSQVGFLTMMRTLGDKMEFRSSTKINLQGKKNKSLRLDPQISDLNSNFRNVHPLKLYKKDERLELETALLGFKKNLPLEYSKGHEVFCSSDLSLKLGEIRFTEKSEVKGRVDNSLKAYESWSQTSFLLRCSLLQKVAQLMVLERSRLSSLIIYEAGKTYEEALADVDEAIDFLNFYAHQEYNLNSQIPGLLSKGVSGIIAPWNFPLAIPCGMASAALVSGNTVLLKSSEKTPLITQELVELFYKAGCPKDVLIHLPGEGQIIGKELSSDPRVDVFVFTGSMNIGMSLLEKLKSKPAHSYDGRKTVVTEMGGKNAIIVTANAEIDETVSGILYAAFAHAGQKCSAASRVIVDEKIYPELSKRLAEAVMDIHVGESFNPATFINPLVSKIDFDNLHKNINEAIREARDNGGEILIDRSKEKLPGYCVGPVLIKATKSMAVNKSSYAQKELFGPVVHLIPTTNLQESIDVFNSTDYALTGGIYSQSQDDIDWLSNRLECGNIYINRPNTGARVAIEPFGGFKLSGTGPKAGGRQYLSLFHTKKVNIDKKKSIFEEGSDYQTSNLDKLSPINVKNITDLCYYILAEYENIFHSVSEIEKMRISELQKWMRDNLQKMLEFNHLNRVIPGQISYDDLSLRVSSHCVLATTEKPSLESILAVILSMSLGIPQVILATNQSSYALWCTLLDLIKKKADSECGFEVFFASHKVIESALVNKNIESFTIDADQIAEEDLISKISKEDKEQLVLRKIQTNTMIQIADNFHEFFLRRRSFAINTMRHGAPLELSEDR